MPQTILHVPHSSDNVPSEVRDSLLLSNEELKAELLCLTDWFTDDLFAVSANLATAVRFPVSGVVVDPERFVDDAQEPMAARGMGVIYERTAYGQTLRRTPSATERHDLLSRYYTPHHARLTQAVTWSRQRHGRALIIDC